jgi:hypothetical protein
LRQWQGVLSLLNDLKIAGSLIHEFKGCRGLMYAEPRCARSHGLLCEATLPGPPLYQSSGDSCTRIKDDLALTRITEVTSLLVPRLGVLMFR